LLHRPEDRIKRDNGLGRKEASAEPSHIDLGDDPYKSAQRKIFKFSPSDSRASDDRAGHQGTSAQSKSLDQRLEDGRVKMAELAEKDMTQFYPSVHNGKKYQYAPTFHKDMQHLEERLKSGQVTKEEVARTYEAIGTMVGTEGGATTRGRRLQLAKNIMFHAGGPDKTDQGEYNTCALTSQQERLFTRAPGKASEIIAEAATTGQWIAPDGKVIDLDK